MVDKSLEDLILEDKGPGGRGGGKGKGRRKGGRGGGNGAAAGASGKPSPWGELSTDANFWLHDDRDGTGQPDPLDDSYMKGSGRKGGKGGGYGPARKGGGKGSRSDPYGGGSGG